jgi:DNA-binding winged helix-turn-helix (wHTH) protein
MWLGAARPLRDRAKICQNVPKRGNGRAWQQARRWRRPLLYCGADPTTTWRDARGPVRRGAKPLFEGFRLESSGLFRLDSAGGAEPIILGARALDLPLLLTGRPGEVVSKDAIMQAVWPGLAVEETNLTVQISALRRVLDRDRAPGSCIQTIPRRGYRFVVPVTSDAVGAADSGPALPVRPSLAVLPFQNMSDDPEQKYFADGVVEDIIAELSRFRTLFAIARSSTFTYKEKAVDVRQVARELGVRHVLEGPVRKDRNNVRVTA